MCLCVSELAQAVVDAGAVPPLILCVQEPELTLKRIAVSALSEIAKHSPEVGKEGTGDDEHDDADAQEWPG